MFENGDAFPFTVGGAQASVTNSHPSAFQILQLWQIYISNVNPLLKISHVPTLQGQIIAAGANPAKISQPLEALMFGIYFISVTSLSEEEVQSTFGEDRSVLLAKFHTGSQQALVNAGFMRSTDIMVLQAYTLYLVSLIRSSLREPVSLNPSRPAQLNLLCHSSVPGRILTHGLSSACSASPYGWRPVSAYTGTGPSSGSHRSTRNSGDGYGGRSSCSTSE